MKRKVLFIFFQSGNQANGGVTSIVEIIHGLQSVEPVILTQAHTYANEQLRQHGFEVLVWPVRVLRGLPGIWSRFWFNIKIWRFLKTNKFTCIHINDIDALRSTLEGIRVAAKKTKVIFNIRGVKERRQPYGTYWKLVNRTDEVVVLSKQMKEELMQRLPLRDRTWWKDHFHTIYSIVNTDRAGHTAVAETDDFFSTGKKHLLYTAAFSQLKGQLPFLEHALPVLAASGYVVHFVGDFHPEKNKYAQRCLATVERLNLKEFCFFHGYTSHVERFYKRADLTLVISSREGLSRCMIESLAYGTPVVSFDVCSASEILTVYQCGLVSPVGNYPELIRNIQILGDNPALRKEYGARGETTASALFGKKKVIHEYEKLYLAC